MRFKTPQLRSDLCDWNCAYLVVKCKIVATDPNRNNYDRKLALKNNAHFSSCVLKINNQLIENAEDLDIAMPLFNLLYYSENYQKTKGSFRNYYRDEPNSGYNNDNYERTRIFYPIKNSKSFDYKTSITGELPAGEDNLENIEFIVPLEFLSRFIRQLDILLIHCEVSLNLKWTQNCVLTSKATRSAKQAEVGPPALATVDAINVQSDLKFNITDCKLYVPVVKSK